MGYGGNLSEQQRARELRAESWTLLDIARELDVSKSSVSLWVRDGDFVPHPRRHNYWTKDNPHPLQVAKLEEIERCNAEGVEWIGTVSEREFLTAGVMLYSGEGSKTDGAVKFANTNPALVVFFVRWLRTFFDVVESRLRVHLYLHQGLDLDSAIRYWSARTVIPSAQFTKPYRAVANNTIRHSKHIMGCPAVVYSHALTHRRVMGLVRALSSRNAIPG
ncbi:MAG: helix-turn-helix domain-containing protein [Actinomycetota bacterium]|nr:helix-turn-helix domain-containing protein [Actinomycetota bacterium]